MMLPSHRRWAFRALLALAGLDSVAAGSWAAVRPEQVFAFLQLAPPHDAFLLPLLGALVVVQGLCLGAAALRPEQWGGLTWVSLCGHLVQSGLWLWLLGVERLPLPTACLLLAHEALWLPGFALFLANQRRGGI